VFLSLKNILEYEGLQLQEITLQALERFTDILLEWNKIHNLTGAKDRAGVYEYILDSLYPITKIDFPKNILDVGTGSGFPGLVLAIVLQNSRFTLCEPIKKRVGFMRFVVLELGLNNITFEQKRVEMLEERFDLITSRAVSDVAMVLDITKDVRDSETRYLLYKGSRVFNELEKLPAYQLSYDILQKNRRNYLYIKSIDVA
jgi:16S rRNA (guanine527-N7)-methyltransferase